MYASGPPEEYKYPDTFVKVNHSSTMDSDSDIRSSDDESLNLRMSLSETSWRDEDIGAAS